MNWLDRLLGRDPNRRAAELAAALETVQRKFQHFLALLEANNRALKTISDMEEKAGGDYLFDAAYVRSSLDSVARDVGAMVDELIALGGDSYRPARLRLDAIVEKIKQQAFGAQNIVQDDLVLPFGTLGRERCASVGSKNAQLGEMRRRVGLPVPDGFAISAWAYKQFIDSSGLASMIANRLQTLDLHSYQAVKEASEDIRRAVLGAEVPDELARGIATECERLARETGVTRFAIRSSALGEDTQFSFAGQYESHLNVPASDAVARYRHVVASKFTPQAIYYAKSHNLAEDSLAMAVGCVAMVDATASGVVYSRDPVRPSDDVVAVHAILGLGAYLVNGTLTPDAYSVDRTTGQIRNRVIAHKPVRLVLDEGSDKPRHEEVPEADRRAPALTDDQARSLAEYAIKLEEHYGAPQDVEWARDREGRIFLLQTRPLKILAPEPSQPFPDTSDRTVLTRGGSTACPGAGKGKVFQMRTPDDLSRVPQGAVLVTSNPFPGLVTVMGTVRAIVTRVGSVASHLATITREYRVPTIVGCDDVAQLRDGTWVTVDASEAIVYEGLHDDIVAARQPASDVLDDAPILEMLQGVLAQIAPLNLVHPADPDFAPENCQTLHDVTRFAHQKGMEAMFLNAREASQLDTISRRLKTDTPLQVHVLSLDRTPDALGSKTTGAVTLQEVGSGPLTQFWQGVTAQGWPSKRPDADIRGFAALLASTAAGNDASNEFREDCFAVVSREYMLCSLRMGYHFSTVEAMATAEPNKNYIRMQFKGGGTSGDRKNRRVALIRSILGRIGFENHSRGDFLDARASYGDAQGIGEKLFLLGRLSIMTKQLDMALSNDAISAWYTKDFEKKLGIDHTGPAADPAAATAAPPAGDTPGSETAP